MLICSKKLNKIVFMYVYTCVCVYIYMYTCRSRWLRGLRRGTAAARLVGLRFEYSRGNGFLSLVSVVCCACASDRSLVQRSPTDSGVSECDRQASIMHRLRPTRGCCAVGEMFFCMYVRTCHLGDPGVDGRII